MPSRAGWRICLCPQQFGVRARCFPRPHVRLTGPKQATLLAFCF
jgi:hypothetical protein